MASLGVFILVPFLLLAVVIFILVIFVVVLRRQQAEQPGSDAWSRPPGDIPTGQWNGVIKGPGVLNAVSGSTYGIFRVHEGAMTFTPDGAAEPDWVTRCEALAVHKRGFMQLNGADVSVSWLEGPPENGAWRSVACTVSREHIDRIEDDDLKGIRERGYADEFIACLAANGARVNA